MYTMRYCLLDEMVKNALHRVLRDKTTLANHSTGEYEHAWFDSERENRSLSVDKCPGSCKIRVVVLRNALAHSCIEAVDKDSAILVLHIRDILAIAPQALQNRVP